MHQEHDHFNGSTALVLWKLDSIQRDVIEHRHETRSDIRTLTERLDSISSPLDRLKDASGFLTALAVVLLAVAGKYDLVGLLLGGSGR